MNECGVVTGRKMIGGIPHLLIENRQIPDPCMISLGIKNGSEIETTLDEEGSLKTVRVINKGTPSANEPAQPAETTMTDGKHEENSTDGHFCDCASLSSAIREIVVRHVTENLVYQDSIEIGPSGDRIKVYGSADDPEGFKVKIRNMLEVRKYAGDLGAHK
jgi:hypothetical protein